MPMIMYTFPDTYDLSGKTLCPFVSSSSSGFSDTISTMQSAEPNVTITEGLSITGSTTDGADSLVSEWLAVIAAEE